MKPAAITAMLCLLMASTLQAQFSLLPQIGFDRAKTTLNQNDLYQFSPLGSKTNFKANIKADYRFKGGHGPYIGIGTAPSLIQIEFTDPSTAWKTAKATSGNLQWKLEAGYQYSFKSFAIGKGSKNKQPAVESPQASRKSCGTYQYKSSCGSGKSSPAKAKQATTLSLQPSMGIAFIPSLHDNIATGNNHYKYVADHSGLALIPAMGFEFGKGKNRIMTVSVQYAKSLGTQDKGMIQTDNNGKPAFNSFQSSTSAWSLSVGLPFSLKKARQVKPQQVQKKSCSQQQYRSRCVKKI